MRQRSDEIEEQTRREMEEDEQDTGRDTFLATGLFVATLDEQREIHRN